MPGMVLSFVLIMPMFEASCPTAAAAAGVSCSSESLALVKELSCLCATNCVQFLCVIEHCGTSHLSTSAPIHLKCTGAISNCSLVSTRTVPRCLRAATITRIDVTVCVETELWPNSCRIHQLTNILRTRSWRRSKRNTQILCWKARSSQLWCVPCCLFHSRNNLLETLYFVDTPVFVLALLAISGVNSIASNSCQILWDRIMRLLSSYYAACVAWP